ncbi:MAG TPA: diaminobutyrate acetyltransferase [Flavobacteriaceae bacterium]|nr:diaminobutyrate acetyltransferase [Flavobacteriaceae bacterium]
MKTTIRKPQINDGKDIWKLVKRIGNLDLNSEYCYFMTADLFSDHCAIVADEDSQELLGFALCIVKPEKKDTLFVWQIGVDQRAQGNGLAKKMINFIVDNQDHKLSYIQATVTDDNKSSRALFSSIARFYKADITKEIYIDAANFNHSHHSEYLYNIGKLTY